MKKGLTTLVLAAGFAFSLPSHAAVFGYYLSGASGSPAAAITAAGHTATPLTGLTATDLANIDVLWIFNGINGQPDANVMGNTASVAAWVQGGGVLSFHDRNVNAGTSAGRYIPGASGVTFTRNTFNNIDVQANVTVTNGPAGSIGNTTLDGGNFSSHGYATTSTLPASAVMVLSEGADTTRAVDFYYEFGAGDVYYSSIPLDFYMGGFGNDPPATAMRTVYAVNEAAFQAELRNGNVPAPATPLLVAVAGLLLMHGRRRTATRS